MHPRRLLVFSALLFTVLLAVLFTLDPSRAGEVRVNITGNSFTGTFGPRTLNINSGDHVVWVWTGGQHSTTSGDSSTGVADGRWDSDIQTTAGTNTPAFSWQGNLLGVSTYFCQLHAPPMAGRVIVGSGIPVPDLRLTEVQYNEPSGFDKIEITNLGAALGDLGRYRIATGASAVSIALTSVSLAPGASLTLHANESGTNTPTDMYLPAIGPLNDAAGSVALYVPNTVNTSLADATQIVDFVEWGAGGQPNEGTAVSASVWSAGSTAPTVAAGHSIEFCGASNQHAGFWTDNPTPNFSGAASNCGVVPTHVSTWGRIKQLYR
jgi:plastocyanin